MGLQSGFRFVSKLTNSSRTGQSQDLFCIKIKNSADVVGTVDPEMILKLSD